MNKADTWKAILKKAFVMCLICIVLLSSLVYWKLLQNGKQVYQVRTQQVHTLIEKNPVFFADVFTVIFPETIACTSKGGTDCVLKSRSLFDQRLSPNQNSWDVSGYFIPSYFGNGSLNLTSSLPMYFITVEDDKISKLFFSGDLKIETIDTEGERQVQDLLLGKRSDLYGIQANISGFEMTYLHDLLSEAEVIVPYMLGNQIVGGIVFLHGD